MSTKTILLLRHGTSPNAFAMSDHQRPLSDHGRAEAYSIGALSQRIGCVPDSILCSDAVRTRQTCDSFLESYVDTGRPDIQYSHAIYNGAPGDYLHALQSLDDAVQTVLLIGHNPTIPSLAATLTDETVSDALSFRSLFVAYAPATLSILKPTDSVKSWRDLSPQSCALMSLHRPEPDA